MVPSHFTQCSKNDETKLLLRVQYALEERFIEFLPYVVPSQAINTNITVIPIRALLFFLCVYNFGTNPCVKQNILKLFI